MTAGIIDYGMGNLASVQRAIAELGGRADILFDPAEIINAERLILPGVGSFRQAMENLSSAGWVEAIKAAIYDKDMPLLGICLGMQLLADKGTEHGDSEGLGFIPGGIVKFEFDAAHNLRIPHVGWNEIDIMQDDPLLSGIAAKTDFYFVHSFYFNAANEGAVITRTPYGINFPSTVRRDRVWGTQFHPEKSGPAGLKILANFLEI